MLIRNLRSSSTFQSTHPRGVRQRLRTCPLHARNFNPRTHVGCDCYVGRVFRTLTGISIHAPTWGATRSRFLGNPGMQYFNPRTHVGCDLPGLEVDFRDRISIHAPTWGATGTKISKVSKCFISIHAPTWGATVGFTNGNGKRIISIHAPTWGATGKRPKSKIKPANFNPRTHVGCDWLRCYLSR